MQGNSEHILDDRSLDLIFRQARTFSKWQKRDVSDVMLEAIYDLMKWGPTSANCQPLRVVYVKSPEAKEKLKPALMEGNVDKTMTAPVTAVLAYDKEFYEYLPEQFPHADARSWFVGNRQMIEETAFRNSSLQGAYFIIAARSLGLDCGPMSGFDPVKVKEAFFPHKHWVVNFLCNLGYGEPDSLYPRGPRIAFDEAAQIV